MIKIEYEFVKEEDKFINVSYNLKTSDKNWKEILKKDICSIIDCNDDLMFIKIGV